MFENGGPYPLERRKMLFFPIRGVVRPLLPTTNYATAPSPSLSRISACRLTVDFLRTFLRFIYLERKELRQVSKIEIRPRTMSVDISMMQSQKILSDL